MGALSQLSSYIMEYGYLAIFLLVFLQQVGVPNPVTNELVLIFCGYLSCSGILNIYKIIAIAVLADVSGSMLIFFVFYFFSKWLISHSPKWLPLTGEKIERIKKRTLSRGQRSIFIGRMTPVIRGYVSVVAGMLEIVPKAFMATVVASAIIWNALLVIIGVLAAPYWDQMMQKSGVIEKITLLLAFIVLILFAGKYFQRKQPEDKP